MEQEYSANEQPVVPLTRLKRRLLIPARILWLVVTFSALGLFTAGLSPKYTGAKGLYQSNIQAILAQNQNNEVVLTPYGQGAAMRAGVLEGDILQSVNGSAVTSLEQAEKLLAGELGTPITIEVRTGNFRARQVTVMQGGEMGQLLGHFGLTSRFAIGYVMASEILFAVICVIIGLAIFWRRSDDWMALLASLTFITVLVGLSQPVVILEEQMQGTRYFLLFKLWFLFGIGLLPVFFYLFPTGEFVPRVTTYLTGAIILWPIAASFYPALYPWHMTRLNTTLTLLPLLGTGVFALFYRYRYRSDEMQRMQIRWIVWGALAATLGLILQISNDAWMPSSSFLDVLFRDFVVFPLGQLFKLLLPVSIVFAIQRYRLWDINILINRALVYGALTTAIIVIYILVVGVLGTTIQERGNLLVSILATGLVAVLVQPLRDRLQRGVNRMMYGERDDPVTVLSRLGQRLEGTLAPDAVLPSLVETVAQTLKLPYVAIEMMNDHRSESQSTIDASSSSPASLTLSYGTPQLASIRVPLIYQSETIGQLIVAPRSHGEALSPMDHHLLENIAHQAGMAVHAVRLTADLQRSRQHIVTAREEERRRLRRDLHDGLGPNLASQGLKLAAVMQMAEKNPASAIPLLDQVMAQNQSTVDEVRRLVYGLRPPALDELGLVAAIRDYVAGTDRKGSLQIAITEPPAGLPPLSAAVEVAAYRIVLEALTNVIRHAQAKNCTIRFSLTQNPLGKNIQIEITDDGIGLSNHLRAGVGLRSMRERAEELDGKLIVESQPRTTRVLAILPLGETVSPMNLATQMENE
jgi:signal transduction histidine kinase